MNANQAAEPKEFDLEAVHPNDPVNDEEMLMSDTLWEMQEEAERDAAEQMQQARQNRANRGYYIGLDN